VLPEVRNEDATVLIDGFVRGTWKTGRTRGKATLVIEPFEYLNKKDTDDSETATRKSGDPIHADNSNFAEGAYYERGRGRAVLRCSLG
jgi:hypothetical protein